jgi:hypothetical protein
MRVFKLLLILLVTLNTGCSDSQQKSSKSHIGEFITGDKMDEKEFWKIIDYSFNVSDGDMQQESETITKKLSEYTPAEIVNFETILTKKIIEANDFKILAIDKIVEGSVADDDFLYFRCWLIGQGQKTFEQTIMNPDYLSTVIEKDIVPQFENLLYVSTDAYQSKTGKKVEDNTFPRNVTYNKGFNYEANGAKMTGTDWTESELPKLYPKLWNKFN